MPGLWEEGSTNETSSGRIQSIDGLTLAVWMFYNVFIHRLPSHSSLILTEACLLDRGTYD